LKTSKPKKSPPKRQTPREYLELQRLMAGAVMRPLTGRGGMQLRSENGEPTKKVVSAFIKPNDRLTFERLEIYNRQYWFRLIDCFYDDYPGLRALLGDRRFDRLARAYLERHPSESFTLRNLGRRLAGFLAAEPKWVAPNPGLALDMARLEWAHIEAFDNEARPPLEMGVLLAADPAQIRWRLQPHITLLRLGYEVDQFLIRVKQNERLRDEASNALEARRSRWRSRLKGQLKPKNIFLAVHRHNDSVYYKRLEAAPYRLLSALQGGATLAAACEDLAATAPARADLGADLRKWFQDWASLGWFCG
jgi:hypothetical protein